jgi:hypothetical protein
MAGFIRRFTEFPSEAALTAIEGVNIIDLAPPGSVSGVGAGFAGIIGEFADCTFATSVDPATGVVTEDIRPIEVSSSQDLLNKGGGWDETIGQFGGDGGNAFAALRNKRFFRLAIIPVNLASGSAVRLFRELPTNTSATDPTPVVAVAAGRVAAGRDFRDGLDRLHTAVPVVFNDTPAYLDGVDGSVTTAAPAATQTLDSAGSLFQTGAQPVKVGDIVVTGVVGAASPTGLNAFTLRVNSIATETQLVLETLDGTNFNFTTEGTLVFRLHDADVADTGGENVFSGAPGYLIPVRPLTDGQGTGSSAGDGNWTVGTVLVPRTVPPAVTATTADPLSGLGLVLPPVLLVAYEAAVQAPNAPNDTAIDALYTSAFAALLSEDAPAREINLIWAARHSNLIRTGLRAHVLSASALGIGRTTVVSPELDISKATALSIVTGDSAPGVGATRDERVSYSWPPNLNFVPEAVNSVVATADGGTTDDGILDETYDSTLVSILSNLAPERNPGEASQTSRRAQVHVLGIGRNVPLLSMNSYISMRQKGIAGLRIDRRVGPVIQSGVTSSLTAGQKNINRRRMADFIEDSLAERFVELSKLPLTDDLKDIIVTEATEFLEGLLSVDNPAAQRIAGFNPVDDVSGNTDSGLAKGIFVIIVSVRTLATADFITVQAEIGEGVVITSTL